MTQSGCIRALLNVTQVSLKTRSAAIIVSMAYFILQYVSEVFPHAKFKTQCLYLGGCWLPAFITIFVSLGVCCSAPPPAGTYTNEDTTSNEHPPPSVLNYSAAPLPETKQHPTPNASATTTPLVPESPERETHVHVRRAAAPCLQGAAARLAVRVSV